MKRRKKVRRKSVQTNAAGRELLEAVRQMHHAVTTGDYSGVVVRRQRNRSGQRCSRRARGLEGR